MTAIGIGVGALAAILVALNDLLLEVSSSISFDGAGLFNSFFLTVGVAGSSSVPEPEPDPDLDKENDVRADERDEDAEW